MQSWMTQAKERARTLAGESDALKQEIAAETVAQNTLRNQVGFLQAAGGPAAASPELQQALSTYLQLADSRDRLATQVWGNLDQTRQFLDQEKQLLAGLQPDLKKMEETWKTELLTAAALPAVPSGTVGQSPGRPGGLARQGLDLAQPFWRPRGNCGTFSSAI